MSFTHKPYFTYFLGLFDLSSGQQSIPEGKKKYTMVERTMSGIHEYFPLFVNNLTTRGNWFALTHEEAENNSINLSLTNHGRLSTKSEVQYRLTLDSFSHYLSDKAAFYRFFQDLEFVPKYAECHLERERMAVKDFSFGDEDDVVLKPNGGCLGLEVLMVKYKEIANLSISSAYQDWTISKLYLSRLYDGYVVSNRIYFLIVKRGDEVSSYLYDEFVNYRALERYTGDPKKFREELITNYSPAVYSEMEFYRDRYVAHRNYTSIFTKEEFEGVLTKVKSYLTEITRRIAPHLLSCNDKVAFHLYGIDAIVTDDLDIKIVDFNGAPSISNRTYPDTECMNYNVLVNELLKIVVDVEHRPFHVPTYNVERSGRYKDQEGELFTNTFQKLISIKTSPPPFRFYIAKSIHEKYPFITEGFFSEARREFYQLYRNPFGKIDVFHGLRDLYENPYTSKSYYNEVADYVISECSRNARVVNKVQGVTYYLANKERLYQRLPPDADYHPPSIYLTIEDKKLSSTSNLRNLQKIQSFLSQNSHIIIKPSNGSQSKGIEVLKNPIPIKVLRELFNIERKFGYSSFLLSRYIDNPWLWKLPRDKIGRKFNIRFYVLLFLAEKPRIYLLNRSVVYLTILEYGTKTSSFSDEDTIHFSSLTNLQNVTTANQKYGLSLSTRDYVRDFKELEIGLSVEEDFLRMCRETISATCQEFRSVNRFVGGSSFNLLAYDTLLDDKGTLHLIEVNRGADMMGLKCVCGDEIVDIFRELFDICVDGREDLSFFEEISLP